MPGFFVSIIPGGGFMQEFIFYIPKLDIIDTCDLVTIIDLLQGTQVMLAYDFKEYYEVVTLNDDAVFLGEL